MSVDTPIFSHTKRTFWFNPEIANNKKDEHLIRLLYGESWDDEDWWYGYILFKRFISSIFCHDFDICVDLSVSDADPPLSERHKHMYSVIVSHFSKYNSWQFNLPSECFSTKDAVCAFKKFADHSFPRPCGRNVFALTKKTKIEGSEHGPYNKYVWVYTYTWCVKKFIQKHKIRYSLPSPRAPRVVHV